MGERTVLVQGGRHFACGQGMVGAILTLGLLPGSSTAPLGWTVTLYDDMAEPRGRFTYRAAEQTWAWIPLVPFMPINLTWRAVAGDAEDRFLDDLPDILAAIEAGVADPVPTAALPLRR